MKRKWFSLVSLLVVVIMLVAACGPAAEETPGTLPEAGTTPEVGATMPVSPTMVLETTPEMAAETPTTEAMVTESPEMTATVGMTATEGVTGTTGGMTGELRTQQDAALEAAGGEQLGGTVSVLASWGGSEQETFMAMVAPFEEATGVQVEYEGSRDINAILTTRVQGGNPPDVAGLPGPGVMAELARAGSLVDLTDTLAQGNFSKEYAQSWADLGTVDGKLVGIFIKASAKGLIWYNPKVWDANGWTPPETWDDLMALSQEMAATGVTPWCEAFESAATSGWPGTDWLEDLVLRQSGPDVYNQWWAGEIKWTSPEIRQAWETYGQIVGDQKMVYGGANTVLTTNFGNVGDPLFTDPPGCYMVHQGSFITDFFVNNTPGLEPVTDFDFFRFPPVNAGDQSLEVAGDLFGMFNDTPQARALMAYLLTPEAQAIWVQRGGAISPNQAVPLDLYPDELSRKAAETMTGAETVAFDASDLMPDAMQSAFLRAILDFVQAPDNLDTILQGLDSVQQDAYQSSQ